MEEELNAEMPVEETVEAVEATEDMIPTDGAEEEEVSPQVNTEAQEA